MKKFLKITGITLGVIVLLVVLLVGYSAVQPMKTFEAKSIDISLPTDSAQLAYGSVIVNSVCVHCHMGEDGKLSGRVFTKADHPFGLMYTGNITNHPQHGIGDYTEGQLAYLFRTGVNKEGRYVGNMMSHPNMSDADMGAIIAYLRSDADIVQASDVEHPLPEYLSSVMIKTMAILGMFKPLPFDGKPVPEVDKTDPIAYGKYLTNEIYECGVCHSQSFETYNSMDPEKTPGYMAGGNMVPDKQFNEVSSSNLTPSIEFGLGGWTEAQFIEAVRNGNRPNGSAITPNMPRVTLASDNELKAIWAYLKSIPAVDVKPGGEVSRREGWCQFLLMCPF